MFREGVYQFFYNTKINLYRKQKCFLNYYKGVGPECFSDMYRIMASFMRIKLNEI